MRTHDEADLMQGSREPVLGWRVWRVDGDRLQSWAVHHHWDPGDNVAACRGAPWLCRTSPGRHCQCGFWALWSPLDCLEMASNPIEPPWYAVGLIAAWGEIALHGREGFRAERASVRCLFTDWAGAVPVPRHGAGRGPRWTDRLRDLEHRLRRRLAPDPDPNRVPILRGVAARYGVPLLSLRAAVESRLLCELGVPATRIAEVRAWVTAVARAGDAGEPGPA